MPRLSLPASKPSSSFSDTRRHYEILDGLRGVAALIVVVFHLLEAFSGDGHSDLIIGHGYLAVDFFFVLSGFVIGYAYDGRWEKMSLSDFLKRRLIRLHPMIVLGMALGALEFYYGAAPTIFPLVSATSAPKLILLFLLGCALIPAPPSLDIRGAAETYPLNGPAWSLFYEYFANLLYALFVRRFSNRVLAALVVVSGAALVHHAVWGAEGDVIGGWVLDAKHMHIALVRLSYPFLVGLLLSRTVRPGRIKHAYLWCSLLLTATLAMPRLGGKEQVWINGIYDSAAILFVFPALVYVGASGFLNGGWKQKLCKLTGDLSYPLYITHYPLIYVFTAWVANGKVPVSAAGGQLALSFAASIAIAYAALKLYDEPVRRWLAKSFAKASSKTDLQP